MRRVLQGGIGVVVCLSVVGGCGTNDTPSASSRPRADSGAGGAGDGSGGSGGGAGAGSGAGGGASGGGAGSSPEAGGASGPGGANGTGGAGDGGGSSNDAGVPAKTGYHLVWHDEFDGASGTLPDPSKWVFETGGNGWGNGELEYYTERAENAAMDGSGSLVITARAESYMGRSYTSARLKTQGKFEHALGRFEARIQIPKGQGIWPAFWMLGNDIGTAGWPTCGEIDIMENIGKEPTKVHGTIHGPGYSGGAGIGAPYSLPSNAPFSDDFHVYAIEWDSGAIRWYVDDANYETHTPADIPGGTKWVYDHPFFLLLNVAVGGQWPGDPDQTTTFPQEMRVDYVRVFDAN